MAEDFVTWLTSLSEEGGAVWAIVLIAMVVLVALPVLAAFGFISRRAMDRGSAGKSHGAAAGSRHEDDGGAVGIRAPVGAAAAGTSSIDARHQRPIPLSASIEVECVAGSACHPGPAFSSVIARSGSHRNDAAAGDEGSTTIVVRRNNDAETRKLGSRAGGSDGKPDDGDAGECAWQKPDREAASATRDAFVIAFPETGSLRIGRESDNDIVLPDPTVHRYHAYIRRTPELTYEIHDLSGQDGNGLRIDGERRASAVLSDGDVVMMGQSRIRFRAG